MQYLTLCALCVLCSANERTAGCGFYAESKNDRIYNSLVRNAVIGMIITYFCQLTVLDHDCKVTSAVHNMLGAVSLC